MTMTIKLNPKGETNLARKTCNFRFISGMKVANLTNHSSMFCTFQVVDIKKKKGVSTNRIILNA